MNTLIGRFRRVLLNRSSSFALLAATTTMVGLVGALLASRDEKFKVDEQVSQAYESRRIAEQQRAQIDRANEELHELRVMNQSMATTLDRFTKSGKNVQFTALEPKDRQSIEEIKSAQARLDARLASLESSIMATPEKAVAVPMLRQQVDALQDRTRGDLDSIRGEIGRLFTLTQWFIGLMFTIALGMFGLSFNLRKASAQAQEKP